MSRVREDVDTDQKPLGRDKRPGDGQDRQHFQKARLAGKAGEQERVICVLKRESLAHSLKTSRWS